MTIRFLILAALFYQISFVAISQSNDFDVDFKHQSLCEILAELHQQYHIQLSYSQTELSKYSISVKGSFHTVDDLLNRLLADLPLEYEKQGEIYVIFKPIINTPQSLYSTIQFTGTVKSKQTSESLPFCTVYINGEFKITDINGRFSFIALNEEYLKIEVSHVGFHHLDTTILAQSYFTCELTPVVNVLKETLILGTKRRYGTQTGMSVGQSRMNPSISDYLPGGANNGITQLLKLQGGIQLASCGTGTSSFWGGYPGQNQMVFDGMTIYSFPFNSELLHPVNTLMVKDIWINKGALGANFGDRVGGIITLTGKEGNRRNSELDVVMDASMLNAMLSLPVNENNAVIVAARHSLWSDYFSKFAQQSKLNSLNTYDIWNPLNTTYKDLNLKYSGGKTNGDQYHISLYGNQSENLFHYKLNAFADLDSREKDERHQLGTSLLYNKMWTNGFNTTFNFTSSHAEWNDENNLNNNLPEDTYRYIWDNKFLIDSRFTLNPKQFIEAGLSVQSIESKINWPDTQADLNSDKSFFQTSAFLRNHIYANPNFFMDVGLRLDYQHTMDQLFVCPRIKGSFLINSSSQINLSWGIYQQYLAYVPVIDELGNYDFIWQGFTQKGNYLQSNVLAVGWSYAKNGWNINTEFYLKGIEGAGRFYYDASAYLFEMGRVRTQGVDISVKKEFGNHLIIQNYTYNNTEEKFGDEDQYESSIYTRDHELKTTLLMNFDPIKFSTSYIYGSPVHFQQVLNTLKGDYNRVDAMLSYHFDLKDHQLETGISVYNILDNANTSSLYLKKYAYSDQQNLVIAKGGMPFYFTLFLHFKFKK